MNRTRSTCPDCNTAMQPIKLIDATAWSLGLGAIQHVELGYAAADAQPSFFVRQVPALGTVKGRICPQCGRIVLYGEAATPS